MKSPIFLDSACFIYTFEQNPLFLTKAQSIFTKVTSGELKAKTSIITLTEVLTKPYKTNDLELVFKYKELFLQMPNLGLLFPDYNIAVTGSRMMAKYNLSLPDAYQLAMAVNSGCKTFLTNDKKFKKVNEIKVLTLEDLK